VSGRNTCAPAVPRSQVPAPITSARGAARGHAQTFGRSEPPWARQVDHAWLEGPRPRCCSVTRRATASLLPPPFNATAIGQMQRLRSGVGITGLRAIAFARGALRPARSQWLQRRRPPASHSATPLPRTRSSAPDDADDPYPREAVVGSIGKTTPSSPRRSRLTCFRSRCRRTGRRSPTSRSDWTALGSDDTSCRSELMFVSVSLLLDYPPRCHRCKARPTVARGGLPQR
jgi:hypothetical protein